MGVGGTQTLVWAGKNVKVFVPEEVGGGGLTLMVLQCTLYGITTDLFQKIGVLTPLSSDVYYLFTYPTLHYSCHIYRRLKEQPTTPISWHINTVP